ncbi:MAG: hypothetical protein R6W96_07575 [Clostridia bacterium]
MTASLDSRNRKRKRKTENIIDSIMKRKSRLESLLFLDSLY